MGVVFKAQNGKPDPFAVKVLRPEKALREDLVRAFRDEAIATAAVRHESVVKVHRCGHDGGFHYLVMEYVDGPSLESLLSGSVRLPWKTATRIAIQVADALAHSHDLGLLHRDVKPGNVLLYRDGRARLTDFGIVKDISTLRGFLVSGRPVGTAAYASPEQCQGKRLGPATDIYSLGATLYHALCGRPPFAGGGAAAVAKRQVEEEPVPPIDRVPELPRALSNAVRKMLAKRPTERHESMEQVAEHLRLVLDGRVPVRFAPARARRRR
jgi:serine/threonine-protein kinase